TLNKLLTHRGSDLQTHMDLLSTLETSLGDSERNRCSQHATEPACERDRLNKDRRISLRSVVNIQQSI
ncbi:hypothetical protein F5879DRAFT_788070, partial [Lentinula edodes]